MGAIPAVGGAYTLEQLEALARGTEAVPADDAADAVPAADGASDKEGDGN